MPNGAWPPHARPAAARLVSNSPIGLFSTPAEGRSARCCNISPHRLTCLRTIISWNSAPVTWVARSHRKVGCRSEGRGVRGGGGDGRNADLRPGSPSAMAVPLPWSVRREVIVILPLGPLRAGCASSDHSRRWGAPCELQFKPPLVCATCATVQGPPGVACSTEKKGRAGRAMARPPGCRRTPLFLPLGENRHSGAATSGSRGLRAPGVAAGLVKSHVHSWSLPSIHRQGSTIELQPFSTVYPALQGAADCLAAAARALSCSLPAHNREPAPCPVAAPAVAGQCCQWSCPPSWRVTCLHGQAWTKGQ